MSEGTSDMGSGAQGPFAGRTSLQLCPIKWTEANEYVEDHHRHSVPTAGAKFALGAMSDGRIVGVALVGRPVNRVLDDGWTLEALRVCTEGHRNACSFLYAASWRATRALGYRKLVTYTRQDESGTSLKAAGWRVVGQTDARSWNTPTRPRIDRDERVHRFRWEVAA